MDLVQTFAPVKTRMWIKA